MFYVSSKQFGREIIDGKGEKKLLMGEVKGCEAGWTIGNNSAGNIMKYLRIDMKYEIRIINYSLRLNLCLVHSNTAEWGQLSRTFNTKLPRIQNIAKLKRVEQQHVGLTNC